MKKKNKCEAFQTITAAVRLTDRLGMEGTAVAEAANLAPLRDSSRLRVSVLIREAWGWSIQTKKLAVHSQQASRHRSFHQLASKNLSGGKFSICGSKDFER